MCTVNIPKLNRHVSVPLTYVTKIMPTDADLQEGKNTIKIIEGEYRDRTGTLMTIDEGDCLIQLGTQDQDVVLLPIQFIVKFQPKWEMLAIRVDTCELNEDLGIRDLRMLFGSD